MSKYLKHEFIMKFLQNCSQNFEFLSRIKKRVGAYVECTTIMVNSDSYFAI